MNYTFMNNTFKFNNPLPAYLLTEHEKEAKSYELYVQEDNRSINYGEYLQVLSKLDGLNVGEYTLIVPKTSHEVIKGGMILCNCMGGNVGNQQTKLLSENPKLHVEQFRYLDLHVIKNNKLVGAIAAEKLLNPEAHRLSCGYGIFINTNNGGNQDMENLLQPVLNNVLGTDFGVLKLSSNRPLMF